VIATLIQVFAPAGPTTLGMPAKFLTFLALITVQVQIVDFVILKLECVCVVDCTLARIVAI